MHGSINFKLKVKCSAKTVLTALRANREKHQEVYKEARATFMTRAIQALEEKTARFKEGKAVSLHIDLSPPMNHTSEYDTAIRMLELQIEAAQDMGSTIELTSDEVRMFVEDKWDWTDAFLTHNSAYSKLARDRSEAE